MGDQQHAVIELPERGGCNRTYSVFFCHNIFVYTYTMDILYEYIKSLQHNFPFYSDRKGLSDIENSEGPQRSP